MSQHGNNGSDKKRDKFSINMFNKSKQPKQNDSTIDELESLFRDMDQTMQSNGQDSAQQPSKAEMSYTQEISHEQRGAYTNRAPGAKRTAPPNKEETLLFNATVNEKTPNVPAQAPPKKPAQKTAKESAENNDPTIVMKKDALQKASRAETKGKGKAASGKTSLKDKFFKNKKAPAKAKKPETKGMKVFKTILKYMVLLMALGFMAGCGVVLTWYLQAPALDYERFEYIESSQIFDQDGNPYESLQGIENREPISITEVPRVVQLAFVSIEDQRFYSHGGVDFRGTAKAIFSVLTSGSLDGPGGSTITQQLLKLTHLSEVSSLKRKIYEWRMAPQLENQMTKQQILESYLNKVNMSQAWGIEAAAEFFFGKSASELTIAQSAVLASIINAPSYFNPLVYDTDEDGNITVRTETLEDGTVVAAYAPENMERALIVVDQMYTFGHICEAEYKIAVDQLKNNKIGLQPTSERKIYSYFTDSVYTELIKDLQTELSLTEEEASDFLLNRGLKIYSTVDPQIQSTLEQNAKDNSLFPAQSSTAKNASTAMSKKTGEKVEYVPQVAMTVIENKTGHVKAILGGREKTTSLSMNRGLQYFQTGSTTKPLTVYAPGIDSGKITLGTTYDDVRINVNGWRPTNSGGGQSGMCTVRRALAQSLNVVCVQAYFSTGWETILPYTEKLGLNIVTEGDSTDVNPAALALGGYTQGQTTLIMASAFSTFPNGGYRMEPIFYTKVLDKDGNVILEKKQERVEVWREGTAWLITDVLQDAVRGGTTNVSVPGQAVAGKTGTTDSERCAWFCGYTPQYTAAVWYGYDENIVTVDGRTYILNINVVGGSTRGPAAFWESCFRDFYKTKALASASFPERPKEVVSTSVDAVSGKMPSALSSKDPRGSKVYSEYFLQEFTPAGTDDMHVECTLCARTKLYATEFCPTSSVYTMVLLRKTEERFPSPVKAQKAEFHAKSEAGIVAPKDGAMCTYHNANTANGVEVIANGGLVTNLSISGTKTVQARLTTASGSPLALPEGTTLSASASNNCVNVSVSGSNIVLTPNYHGTCTVTVTSSTPFKQSVAYQKTSWEETFSYTFTVSTGSATFTAPTITLSRDGVNIDSTDSGTAGTYTLPTATVHDQYDGSSLTIASIVITDALGAQHNTMPTTPGVYTVTYTTVPNSKGQSGTKTITVTLN